MTLSDVRLVPGTGLVGRTESTLWWTSDERLLDALRALPEKGFKSLADAILSLDFEIGGVAAVDLERRTVFLSGVAFLVTGSGVLDGSTTGTWIEQPLTDLANFAVNAHASTTDDATNLIAGIVPGAGFVFGRPELAESPPATPAESAQPEPSPSDRQVADPDVTAKFDAAETMIVPTADPVAEVEPTHDDAAESTPDEPRQPIVAVVEFDDGRQLEITAGLIVGRNPASGELPIGFDSVTVLGEFVSRRHWQLDVRDMVAVLTDLGSASGTTVESDGTTKLGPDDSVELGERSRILFADHWATVRVKAK